MEWLIDNRSKSVASSAQRVVADMHRDLDLQKKKVTDLESLVSNLTALCTESLENEIFRLELRRKELHLELERTDTAIQDRQTRLENARDDVRNILISQDQGQHIADTRTRTRTQSSNSTTSTPSRVGDASSMNRASAALQVPSSSNNRSPTNVTTGRRGRGVTDVDHTSNARDDNKGVESTPTRMITSRSRTTSAELRSSELEEQYMEETEMLVAVRDVVDNPVLFIVHCSFIEDVIVYVPSSNLNDNKNGNQTVAADNGNNGGSSILHCHKISEFTNDEHGDGINAVTPDVAENGSVFSSELSNYDYLTTYGPKIVPNHERDYPHIREMIEPPTLNDIAEGIATATGLGPLHGNDNGHKKVVHNNNESIGTLLGAIQLPMIPDVIIDVWQASSSNLGQRGRMWATTTIDGVSFSVIERIFMISQSNWGVSKVVQVDVFGRHPAKGYLVLEHVTA